MPAPQARRRSRSTYAWWSLPVANLITSPFTVLFHRSVFHKGKLSSLVLIVLSVANNFSGAIRQFPTGSLIDPSQLSRQQNPKELLHFGNVYSTFSPR